MVVLSACETALGDIYTAEGVYGLQRGFKMAGVNSILMSLWKVDDAATMMLMTEFYRNFLSGMSKRESLLEAQDKVRNFRGYINGEKRKFSDPKYWAGFILLDALD
jgi:CHAT domain-containing protein